MTTITNRMIPGLHRQEWQMMTSAPTTSTAGSFIVHDRAHSSQCAMYCVNSTTHYLYNIYEDAWEQIASGSIAGTWGAGACGARTQWSRTVTANGGSTTTITVASATYNLSKIILNSTVRFLSGTAANLFQERTVTGFVSNYNGTSTITLDSALPASVASGDTLAFSSGRYWVMGAGTVASGIFKEFDPATMTWSSPLATTNLPASIGTSGKLVATPGQVAYATGTATSGGSTTLTNSAKTWTTNQWTNYQVRITAGTGVGQTRTIASNTGTALTVSASWTTTPNATSVYVIEANDDYMYFFGNNAVTMYRYSISANTWTVLSPSTARAGTPGAGMSWSFVQQTGNAIWANESDIMDGRFIYSFRGGSALDRYDIASNKWLSVTTVPQVETFASGSGYESDGARIYARKDATNRFFYYDVVANTMVPWSTNPYPDGAAVEGDKIFVWDLPNSTGVSWVYSLRNSGTELHRALVSLV